MGIGNRGSRGGYPGGPGGGYPGGPGGGYPGSPGGGYPGGPGGGYPGGPGGGFPGGSGGGFPGGPGGGYPGGPGGGYPGGSRGGYPGGPGGGYPGGPGGGYPGGPGGPGNIKTLNGNGQGKYKDSNRINSNIVMLSLVLAMVTKFLTGILYAKFLATDIFREFQDFVSLASGDTTGLPRPVVIGLIFVILYLILVGGIMILSFMMNQFERDILFKKGAVAAGIVVTVGAILMFGLAALFQWIYQMDTPSIHFTKRESAETYVFILDDSGSMDRNDPTKQAVDAVYDVMRSAPSGSQFMVYRFDSDTEIIRSMGPLQDPWDIDQVRMRIYHGALTYMGEALERVFNDYRTGKWSVVGNVKVILLADGDADDSNVVRRVLNDYAQEGITISTVGLGNFSASLLGEIANRTGGKFVSVSQAADLSGGFSEVIETSNAMKITDDLLHTRFRTEKGFLYGLLRVVFLTILGVFLALMVLEAYGLRHTFGFSFFVISIPKALIGALALELKTGLVTLIIYWVLISLTIVKMRVRDTGIKDSTKINIPGNAPSSGMGGRYF